MALKMSSGEEKMFNKSLAQCSLDMALGFYVMVACAVAQLAAARPQDLISELEMEMIPKNKWDLIDEDSKEQATMREGSEGLENIFDLVTKAEQATSGPVEEPQGDGAGLPIDQSLSYDWDTTTTGSPDLLNETQTWVDYDYTTRQSDWNTTDYSDLEQNLILGAVAVAPNRCGEGQLFNGGRCRNQF